MRTKARSESGWPRRRRECFPSRIDPSASSSHKWRAAKTGPKSKPAGWGADRGGTSVGKADRLAAGEPKHPDAEPTGSCGRDATRRVGGFYRPGDNSRPSGGKCDRRFWLGEGTSQLTKYTTIIPMPSWRVNKTMRLNHRILSLRILARPKSALVFSEGCEEQPPGTGPKKLNMR